MVSAFRPASLRRALLPAGLALGLLSLMVPGAARAHGIETNLSALQSVSDGLLLQSHFSSGEPTVNAAVRLVSPDGQTRELGRTDAQGQLSFALPKGASGDWELQVDGGPGHRDYLEMPVQAGQARLDQLSEHHHGAHPLAWLSALGATAMLLGLQRIRRLP